MNAFYIFENSEDSENKDEFNSLYSDTININIKKEKGNFKTISENKLKLNNNNGNKNITEQIINGVECIKEIEKSDDGETDIYYLNRNDNSYYIIEVNIGKGFETLMLPIIEKMVSTFEIL